MRFMNQIFRYQWLILASIGLFVLAACGGADPEHSKDDINTDDEQSYTIDFADETAFETTDLGEAGALKIEDGQYIIQVNNVGGARYLWGASVWEDAGVDYPQFKNVSVETTATVQEGNDDNWYGVACRIDQFGSGYAFLVGSDGFWTITRIDGRSLFLLEPWQQNDAIKTGHATNQLHGYCLDDYLSFYVNDEFVGDFMVEESDDRINRVGGVGLVAGGIEGDTVVVVFDDLTATSAELKDAPNTPAPTEIQPTETNTAEPLETLPAIGDDFGDGNGSSSGPPPTATGE